MLALRAKRRNAVRFSTKPGRNRRCTPVRLTTRLEISRITYTPIIVGRRIRKTTTTPGVRIHLLPSPLSDGRRIPVGPVRQVGRPAGRPQLSTIIRDLSRHCRAAKIAGCRLRGQEIAAASDDVWRHCSPVPGPRCVKTLLTSTPPDDVTG